MVSKVNMATHTFLVVMKSLRELSTESTTMEAGVWGTVNAAVTWPMWHPIKDAITEELD
jgi:hypothetical protein